MTKRASSGTGTTHFILAVTNTVRRNSPRTADHPQRCQTGCGWVMLIQAHLQTMLSDEDFSIRFRICKHSRSLQLAEDRRKGKVMKDSEDFLSIDAR